MRPLLLALALLLPVAVRAQVGPLVDLDPRSLEVHRDAGCGFSVRLPPGWLTVADLMPGTRLLSEALTRADGQTPTPARLVVVCRPAPAFAGLTASEFVSQMQAGGYRAVEAGMAGSWAGETDLLYVRPVVLSGLAAVLLVADVEVETGGHLERLRMVQYQTAHRGQQVAVAVLTARATFADDLPALEALASTFVLWLDEARE